MPRLDVHGPSGTYSHALRAMLRYDAGGSYMAGPTFLPISPPPLPCCCSAAVPAEHRRHDESIWRNSDGDHNWFHFEHAVRRAANLANDLGLFKTKSILERIPTRGESILRRFGCAEVTLSVFTDNLPNTRGLSKDQIGRDLKDARAIQKAQRPGSKIGAAPSTGGTRRARFRGAPAFRGHATSSGGPWQRAPPAGFAPQPAKGCRFPATAAQPIVLPFPSGAGGFMKGKSGKGIP